MVAGVVLATLSVLTGCAGSNHAPETPARVHTAFSPQPTPSVSHLSRKDFLIFADDVCEGFADLPPYVNDFRDYRSRHDRVLTLRSLAAEVDTIHSKAALEARDDAPAALRPEYLRHMVAPLSDMSGAANAMFREYRRSGEETAAFLQALGRLGDAARVITAYGSKYRLSACHV